MRTHAAALPTPTRSLNSYRPTDLAYSENLTSQLSRVLASKAGAFFIEVPHEE